MSDAVILARALLSALFVEASSVILMKFAALTLGVGFFISGWLGLVFEPAEASFRLFKIWIGWLPPEPSEIVRRPLRPTRPTKAPRVVQVVKFLPAPTSGSCGVCASALDGEIVHCHDCEAAHHRACFAYNTRCSAYACGCTETRESGRKPVKVVPRPTIFDYWD